jgi:hypothetical protein
MRHTIKTEKRDSDYWGKGWYVGIEGAKGGAHVLNRLTEEEYKGIIERFPNGVVEAETIAEAESRLAAAFEEWRYARARGRA